MKEEQINTERYDSLSGYKRIAKHIKINKDINNISMHHNQVHSSVTTRNSHKNISTIFNPYQIYNSARNKPKNKYYLSTEGSNSHCMNASSVKVNFPHIYVNNSFQTKPNSKQKYRTPKSKGTHTISYEIPNENKKVLSNKEISHYNTKIKNNIPLHNKTKIKKSSVISLRLPPKRKITLLNNNDKHSTNISTNEIPNNNSIPKSNDSKIEIQCKNIEDIPLPHTITINPDPPLSTNENLIYLTQHNATHYIQSKPGVDHFGNTKINQDTFIFLENIFDINNFDILGVLDGHGKHGHNVSSFVSNRIISHFTNTSTYTSSSPSLSSIISSFTMHNYSLLHSFYSHIESLLPQQHFDVNFSGTTCVIVFRLSTKMIISNIGDSRAVLIRRYVHSGKVDYACEELSEDHKPGVLKEKRRIEMKGGVVKCWEEDAKEGEAILRVWLKGEKYPGIAISRTLGDEIAKGIGVICTPDIREIDLQGDECCVIVASDGVWDFLSNERVKDIVIPFYMRNDPKGAVNSIVSVASVEWERDGSARDDITCIAYFFPCKEHEITVKQSTYYNYNNMYYYNNTYW